MRQRIPPKRRYKTFRKINALRFGEVVEDGERRAAHTLNPSTVSRTPKRRCSRTATPAATERVL